MITVAAAAAVSTTDKLERANKHREHDKKCFDENSWIISIWIYIQFQLNKFIIVEWGESERGKKNNNLYFLSGYLFNEFSLRSEFWINVYLLCCCCCCCLFQLKSFFIIRSVITCAANLFGAGGSFSRKNVHFPENCFSIFCLRDIIANRQKILCVRLFLCRCEDFFLSICLHCMRIVGAHEFYWIGAIPLKGISRKMDNREREQESQRS